MGSNVRFLVLAGWWVLILAGSTMVYDPSVLSDFGFLSLVGGSGDGTYLWISLIRMVAQVVLLSGVLWSIHSIAKLGRLIPFVDFLLVFWPMVCGVWITLKRLLFASTGSDWWSILEPGLLSITLPLILTGTGSLIFRIWRSTSNEEGPGESTILKGLLGKNVVGAAGLSFLLFLLALAGLWKPAHLWVISVLLLVLGSGSLLLDFRALRSRGFSLLPSPPGAANYKSLFLQPSIYTWGMVLILLFGIFHLCWLPPDDSDELRYHLTFPKRYLEAGGFVVLPDQLFSYFPTGMEMLMGVPLSLDWGRPDELRMGIVSGGKFIHAWMAFLCVALLLVWYRELEEGDERIEVEPLLPLLFLAIPFVPVLASWAFVDFASSLGWIASAYFGWRYFYRGGSNQDLLLTCVSLGWSLQVKYTGLAWCFVFGVLWIVVLISRRRNGSSLVPVVLIPAFLCSPWLLNNLIRSGNPFAPMLSGVFGFGFDPVQKAFYDWHAGMKGDLNGFWNLGLGEKFFDLFLLPFRAACEPAKFENNPIGGLLLLFLPCFFFGLRSKGKGMVWMGSLALGTFFLWGLTYRDPRFAIPLWGFYLLVGTVGLSKVLGDVPTHDRRQVAAGLTVVLVFLSASQSEEVFRRFYAYSPAIVRQIDPDDYLARRLPSMRAIREVERKRRAPSEKPTLLLLGQEQSYYFDSPVRGTDYFDGPFLAGIAREASSVEAISNSIRNQGVDWIFINRETLEAHPANLLRGLWFAADTDQAVETIERIQSGQEPSLTLVDGDKIPAFRRMHTWLIRHPGYREVHLQSVAKKDRPLAEIYRKWISWPEMKGISIEDLPRTSYSLLVWDGIKE